MTLRARLAAIVAAVALALALSPAAAAAEPTGPAPAYAWQCPNDPRQFCMWINSGFPGIPDASFNQRPYGTCINLPSGINDKASSVVNNLTRDVLIVTGSCSAYGVGMTVQPGRQIANLGDYGLNDRISAIIFK